MTIDDGGTAYPTAHDEWGRDIGGMTLLDYFAGVAMRHNDICRSDRTNTEVAQMCYDLAAAMVAEKRRREKAPDA